MTQCHPLNWSDIDANSLVRFPCLAEGWSIGTAWQYLYSQELWEFRCSHLLEPLFRVINKGFDCSNSWASLSTPQQRAERTGTRWLWSNLWLVAHLRDGERVCRNRTQRWIHTIPTPFQIVLCRRSEGFKRSTIRLSELSNGHLLDGFDFYSCLPREGHYAVPHIWPRVGSWISDTQWFTASHRDPWST